MKLFHFREKCIFSSDTLRFPSSWTINPRGFYWWLFPTLNFEHGQQMDVERNQQSFWEGKGRKYWTPHWLQPVLCKVFPSWCCSWSGNGWALPWVRSCWGSSLILSTLSVCFPWFTSLSVGWESSPSLMASFPGCQDWELYILFAFSAQPGLYFNRVSKLRVFAHQSWVNAAK